MNRIEMIKEEIRLVKHQTDKLIKDIPTDQWLASPNVLDTNVNWQIGHVFLANYLHGIASITGPNETIRTQVNIPDYIKFYGLKSDPTQYESEKPSKEDLLNVYELGYELIFKGIDALEDSDLDKPTAIPNPAVKTKYEALMWMFKHQAWHNGQIAMLNRVLNVT